jgi:hypothetical protein
LPNIATEASNLLRHRGDKLGEELADLIKSIVESCDEKLISTADAIQQREYRRLGVTDAAVIFCLSENPDLSLLTDDLDLYLAASAAGHDVYNFTHLREQYQTV